MTPDEILKDNLDWRLESPSDKRYRLRAPGRALCASFFAVDPYGIEYKGAMCAIEHALSYLRMGRECNVP